MKYLVSGAGLLLLAVVTEAQQTVWGQCGGIGWTGPTTCASGSVCTYSNAYYSQCLPGTATSGTTTTSSRTTSSSTTSSRTTTTMSTSTSSRTTTTTSRSTTSSSTTTSSRTTTSSTTSSGPTASSGCSNGGCATGVTTRYWDCCKPSCAWTGKASVNQPVNTCDANNNILASFATKSACDGGTAYMCSNQIPWAVSSTLAYGYAAVNIAGGTEASWCCQCYELTFTSGPIAGQVMVVQATNTGGDLGSNQFDIAMPGGGVGAFNGCTSQYGAPSSGWGSQYGGVASRSDCDALPAAIRNGCYFRFDWYKAADNPGVAFRTVTCPSAITANTGCIRS